MNNLKSYFSIKNISLGIVSIAIGGILLLGKEKPLPQIEKSKLPITLPTIYVNKQSIENGNSLQAIFRKRIGDGAYEITFSFTDEDHPIYDNAYDIIRSLNYHRIIDLESVVVYSNKENRIEKIDFNRTYAGDSNYNDTNNLHKTHTITENPIKELYISTWNNMFVEKKPPTNDVYTPINLASIPMYSLSRKELDDYFSK